MIPMFKSNMFAPYPFLGTTRKNTINTKVYLFTYGWNFTDMRNFTLQHRRESFTLCTIAHTPAPAESTLPPPGFEPLHQK